MSLEIPSQPLRKRTVVPDDQSRIKGRGTGQRAVATAEFQPPRQEDDIGAARDILMPPSSARLTKYEGDHLGPTVRFVFAFGRPVRNARVGRITPHEPLTPWSRKSVVLLGPMNIRSDRAAV